ncbi:LptF/LptG family permease [Candidatus Fermentibacteria bacterium]|nr:LptF/LptG family permease [Candidatus Fermentibacteria bacterium]
MPFVGALTVLTFILIMNHLLKVFDMLLGRGVPLWAVAKLLFLMLPFTFALTVPMSTLVATLMAFGRLSADNETVAVQTSGISLGRLLFPALVAAGLLSAAMMYFNNVILPQVNHEYAALYADISRKKPAVHIRAGVFINDFPGYHILIRSEDEKTGLLHGVTVYEDAKGDEGPRTILAQRGRLESRPDEDMLTLHLYEGEMHQIDPTTPDRYLRLQFQTTSLNLAGLHLQLEQRQRSYKSDREMTTREIRQRIAGFREEINGLTGRITDMVDSRLSFTLGPLWPMTGTVHAEPAWGGPAELRMSMKLQNEVQTIEYKERDVSRYAVEIQKKFSVAVSCLVFVVIGAPIGVITRRGGLGTGFGMSLIFFVVYYVFLIGGEELADRRFISPAVAMWAANAIVGSVGLYLVGVVMLEWRPRLRLPAIDSKKAS